MTTANPRLVIFDVNETLSDMGPMSDRFESVGAPPGLAATWFASVLRDGFALTATGQNPSFAKIASQALAGHLSGVVGDVDAATKHIMEGFATLPVHPDVVPGVRGLRELGLRLVTLSNGATTVARGLFDRNGIGDAFDRLLSVEDAAAWKPAAAAYRYALDETGVVAQDAVLVAVHPWDIHGASRAGLRTCWINRDRRDYPGYFVKPDIEATSVVDLADQLGRAG